MNNTEPLPFYKEPLYFSGLITVIGIGLLVYSISKGSVSSGITIPSVIIIILFGAATYFMWDTRCPHCKRPFVKKEQLDWKEDL